MEPGRQRLSQRRKAAALTQGPLTEHLAVERSALVFRTPGGSAQQLAELFTESKPGVTRSGVPGQAQTTSPNQPVEIPPRPGRLTWFPASGVLAAILAGGAASVLFVTSHHTPVPPDAARIPATMTPASATPAPEPKNSTAPPTGELGKPIDAAVSSGATTAPGPQGNQGNQGNHQTTIRRQPSASRVTPPAGTRAIPAEVSNAWPGAAGLRARDQRWKQFRPKPPHPSEQESPPTSD